MTAREQLDSVVTDWLFGFDGPDTVDEIIEAILSNLSLVLEAAREAGKAEPMNAVLPWSTLWRVPKAEPTPDEKP